MLETARKPLGFLLQVGQLTLDYLPGVSLKMIEAFAYTARDIREEAGVKQVRIAAALDVDQSTIAYFESGHWPRKRDLEETLRAYAQELDIPENQIPHEAMLRWESSNGHRGKPT